jgi:hypothetical protein
MATLDLLFGNLGIRTMPWVTRAYLVLFLVFVLMLIYATTASGARADKLFDLAADSVKTVLGAVLGSLSATWAARPNAPEQEKPESE